MHRRATTAILMSATGTVLAGSLAMTAVAFEGGPEVGKAAYETVTTATGHPQASKHDAKSGHGSKHKAKHKARHKPKKRIVAGTSRETDRKTVKKKKALAGGLSTATSFWDPETASGKPMSYKTLASPYWPLGTKVRITYHGKSVTGVVQDFGPAEWAVKQHTPPAIIDLSEKMMDDLSGSRGNVIPVRFKVLKLGDGPRYVHKGTGYDLAWGK